MVESGLSSDVVLKCDPNKGVWSWSLKRQPHEWVSLLPMTGFLKRVHQQSQVAPCAPQRTPARRGPRMALDQHMTWNQQTHSVLFCHQQKTGQGKLRTRTAGRAWN